MSVLALWSVPAWTDEAPLQELPEIFSLQEPLEAQPTSGGRLTSSGPSGGGERQDRNAQLACAFEHAPAAGSRAGAANQAKDDLPADTSHELRTPLSAILGCSGLQLGVTDAGLDIAPGALERLLEPLVQAHASTTRRCGGADPGLSTVRELVEIVGGSLQLDSHPDEDSTFRLQPLVHTRRLKHAGTCEPSIASGA